MTPIRGQPRPPVIRRTQTRVEAKPGPRSIFAPPPTKPETPLGWDDPEDTGDERDWGSRVTPRGEAL